MLALPDQGGFVGVLVGLVWQCLTKGVLWGFWLDSLLINKRNLVPHFRTLSELASVGLTIGDARSKAKA